MLYATRNLPEETHRASKVRAAQHGRSTEAEIRDIIEAVRLANWVKLGRSWRRDQLRRAGLRDEDLVFDCDKVSGGAAELWNDCP